MKRTPCESSTRFNSDVVEQNASNIQAPTQFNTGCSNSVGNLTPQQNAQAQFNMFYIEYIYIQIYGHWQQNFEYNVERVIYWFDSEIFEMWT